MRILFVGWVDHVHFIRWAEYFAKKGHKVWALSDKRGEIKGVKVLPHFISRLSLRKQGLILSLFKKMFNIDLVHAHWAPFGFIPACADIHPTVVTAWGSDVYLYDRFDENTKHMISTALLKADLITVDSSDLKESMDRFDINKDNIRVVQWGVDTETFKPCPMDFELRKSYDIDHEFVLYSPRNIFEKYNTDIILHAVKKITEVGGDVVLLQKVYQCPQENIDAFMKLARDLNIEQRVRIVEDMPYSQLPAMYNLADVVISVPSTDATPMSVLEAMACGVVPVVSDLPSLHEWITDGVNGFIVPIRDHIALADRILFLINNSKNDEFANLNVEIIKKRADHAKNMDEVERLYYRLIKLNRNYSEQLPETVQ